MKINKNIKKLGVSRENILKHIKLEVLGIFPPNSKKSKGK